MTQLEHMLSLDEKQQQVVFGKGTLYRLPELLNIQASDRCMVFHGRGSYQTSGGKNIIDSMKIKGSWRFFSNIPANPELDLVKQATERYLQVQPTKIIALGGGSVIDTAKAVLANVFSEGEEAFLSSRFQFTSDKPQFIAIPTTAGSGSEATHFAVLYKKEIKYSLAHELLLPDIVILDPETTLSCPTHQTLAATADAICQSIESYWNTHGTQKSQSYAKEALKLIIPQAIHILNKPQDIQARELVLYGAHLAGKAINLTKTTAGHALSYGLTTTFGIPHGIAVLLVMEKLIPFMEETFHFFQHKADYDSLLPPCDFITHNAFVQQFKELVEQLNPYLLNERKKLSCLSPQEVSRISEMLTDKVNLERLSNHPIKLDKQQIKTIYLHILSS